MMIVLPTTYAPALTLIFDDKLSIATSGAAQMMERNDEEDFVVLTKLVGEVYNFVADRDRRLNSLKNQPSREPSLRFYVACLAPPSRTFVRLSFSNNISGVAACFFSCFYQICIIFDGLAIWWQVQGPSLANGMVNVPIL